MKNTQESAGGIDQTAELEEWYAELGRIWDEQKQVGEGTERWKQLCRDEEELGLVIAELEAGITKPAIAPAETDTVQGRQAGTTTELRLAAATVLADKPVVEEDSPVTLEPEQGEQTRKGGAQALMVKLTAATGNPGRIAAAFRSAHPDTVYYWSELVEEEIEFDGDGKLVEEWNRNIQLWLHALFEARAGLAPLREAGAIGKDEFEDALQTYTQAINKLQNTLRLHPAADEQEGKPVGMRNKPGRMTDGGTLRTIRPISGDANAATWGRKSRYADAS